MLLYFNIECGEMHFVLIKFSSDAFLPASSVEENNCLVCQRQGIFAKALFIEPCLTFIV